MPSTGPQQGDDPTPTDRLLSAAEHAAVLMALLGVRDGDRVLVVGGDPRLVRAAAAAAGEQGRVSTEAMPAVPPVDRLLVLIDRQNPPPCHLRELTRLAAGLAAGGRAVICLDSEDTADLLAAAGLEPVGQHPMTTAGGRRTASVGMRRLPVAR